MDLVIELDNEGRIWVSPADDTAREEAWLQGADDTPLSLRASGLCPLEEKYMLLAGPFLISVGRSWR